MNTFLKSFVYASQGIRHCLLHERNFAIHCLSTMLVVGAGWLFQISSLEWVLVLLNIALVLAFEMLNSALERFCNLVHPQHSPAIKIIKDVAAGAVLIVSIIAAICGGIIFIPKIFFI